MTKNGRIKRQQVKSGRIPVPDVPASTDHMTPVFKFQHAVDSGSLSLHDCSCAAEISAVIDCFKKMEGRTWQQVKASTGKKDKTGLGFTLLDVNQLPAKGVNLDQDVRDRVFELRVTQTSRLLCFRDGRVCNVVWYDPNHSVTG